MNTNLRRVLLFGLLLLVLPGPVLQADGNSGEDKDREAALQRIQTLYDRLQFAPRDSYLNYAIATLARREDIDLEKEGFEFPLVPVVTDDPARRVDLFRLTSGAMALHESLQLSELLGPRRTATGETVLLSDIQPPNLETLNFRRLLEEEGGSEATPFDLAEARLVPNDWVYLRFASGADLVAFLREAGWWVEHIRLFYGGALFDGELLRRLAGRLGLPDPITFQALYNALPGPITMTLSDTFLKEGADLTMILPRAVSPEFLGDRQSDKVTRFTGEAAGRLVLSTSKKALDRVEALAASSQEAAQLPKDSLAAAAEFEYMRNRLPGGSGEAVFLYLSDTFLHRLVSPRLRILESRRVRCASHLRTLVNACLLYFQEHGEGPDGLETLVKNGYLEQKGALLQCPHEGAYTIADGHLPSCSVHGRLGRLTPHLELDLDEVAEEEAAAYRRFARSYTALWRRHFDPVGVSMRRDGASWDVDMEVLPIAERSTYRNLGGMADGRPVEGNIGLVAPSTVWLLSARINPTYMDKLGEWMEKWKLLTGEEELKSLKRGFHNQVFLGLMDERMLFGFNISAFIGEAVQWRMSKDVLLAPLIGAANLPAYLAVPVKGPEEAARFMETFRRGIRMKGSRPEGGLYSLKVDAYDLAEEGLHAVTLEMFTFKIRVFYAVDDGFLVLATRPDVLRNVMEKGIRIEDKEPYHVRLSLFPENWRSIASDMKIGYEEAARKSCINALSEARSFTTWGKEKTARALGTLPRCPDRGAYIQEGGQGLHCTIHGTPEHAFQLMAPPDANPSARLLEGLRELTFSLRFTELGVHCVVRVKK